MSSPRRRRLRFRWLHSLKCQIQFITHYHVASLAAFSPSLGLVFDNAELCLCLASIHFVLDFLPISNCASSLNFRTAHDLQRLFDYVNRHLFTFFLVSFPSLFSRCADFFSFGMETKKCIFVCLRPTTRNLHKLIFFGQWFFPEIENRETKLSNKCVR